ncbi:MAG TPA: NAD(P)/FAD-dependent oxidoreductase [Pyrinomonadaceae bacterium]|jgi:phytoene dehydrogenase-like protein|nr:NAD(P)/FAD-dependent oxidoreductase [Pyrinomonadaceae bacterium]
MSYEVVVVGGGIGGLTAAALLAARGVKVCLIEKESRVGGCVASFQKFGYEFEPGAGLYASWQPGEVHERVFAELPVAPPEVHPLSPAYVVRLPDHTEVALTKNTEEFEESLRACFPECPDAAINFYRELAPVSEATHRAANHTTAQHLTQTSTRFRRFIDAQLQIFAQCDSRACAYSYAATALTTPRRGMYAIRGGASALADTLVEAIRKSGGTVRLNTTVLRLAYDSSGRAVGVDLLSGETIEATRAIVSNLTVWDTYGKLVGLSRTPGDVRARLKNLNGWGAYLLFLGLDEEACARLPADHILALTGWQEGQTYDAEEAQFMFAVAPVSEARAPAGRRAVTISTFTESSQWFSFHEDETELEEQDQAALEIWWERLHAAMPELGDGVEVIETMTPRDYYENTRRKLGMVYGINQSLDISGTNSLTYRTTLPNLFMVGDTVFPGQGVAAVTHSGLIVANEIAPPAKR